MKKLEENSSTRIKWLPVSLELSDSLSYWLEYMRGDIYAPFGIPKEMISYGIKQNRNPTDED